MIRNWYILPFILFAACHEEEIRYSEGGYKYVQQISKEDSSFWCLPVKDSMPADDSFLIAYFSPTLYKAFNEPNLSLAPAQSDIFRFVFHGLEDELIFITLTSREIVIKKRKTGHIIINDESQLTKEELFHLNLLDLNFPIHKRNHPPRRQKYLDSLVVMYPRLLDARYYKWLCDKVSRPDTIPFTISTKKYRIATSVFKKWVDTLNASGYWRFPYDHKCKGSRGTATHMAAYTLEANTRHQYNIVRNHTCPCDSSAYVRACNQLAILAGLEKEFELIWGCD